MSDSKNISEILAAETREEAAEMFMDALGFSMEEMQVFVETLDNTKFAELLRRFFSKKRKEAYVEAFPEEPGAALPSYRGYLEVAGTVQALKVIENDLRAAVTNFREYEKHMAEIRERDK